MHQIDEKQKLVGKNRRTMVRTTSISCCQKDLHDKFKISMRLALRREGQKAKQRSWRQTSREESSLSGEWRGKKAGPRSSGKDEGLFLGW